jgi:hypothetical protein
MRMQIDQIAVDYVVFLWINFDSKYLLDQKRTIEKNQIERSRSHLIQSKCNLA